MLFLVHNHLGDEGAAALAPAIASACSPAAGVDATAGPPSPRMRSVSLLRNGIGPAGVAALAAALRQHGALGELDLSANPVGVAGVTALCE